MPELPSFYRIVNPFFGGLVPFVSPFYTSLIGWGEGGWGALFHRFLRFNPDGNHLLI